MKTLPTETRPKPAGASAAPVASRPLREEPPEPKSGALPVVFLVLLFAGWLAWYFWPRPVPTQDIAASGSIEATSVDLAPKVPGRVLELRVKDGDRVEKGQIVALLDGVEQGHALQQAEATLQQARARLAQSRVALRQQIAAQRAAQAQSEAAVQATRVRVPQADVNVALQQQTVEAQIAQARAQVESAAANERSARSAVLTHRANLRNANVTYRRAQDDRVRYDRLRMDGYVTTQQWEQAVAAEDTARAQVSAGQSQLQVAQALAAAAAHALTQARASLQAAIANRNSVAARQYDVAASQAQARQAQAALELTQANADLTEQRRREIEAASAGVKQAEALLEQARANQGYTELRAPFRGVVLTHSVEAGDLVAVGSTVVTIGNLDRPYLRVFISERDLGRVRLGQAADVTVDAWPGRIFKGRVDEIRNRAEYTLGNVQTQEERVKLVFGVRILLDNPEWVLKPGLPADAVLRSTTVPGT